MAEAGALVADIELREGATPAVVAGSWIRGFLLWMPLLAVAIMGALVDRMRRLRPAE